MCGEQRCVYAPSEELQQDSYQPLYLPPPTATINPHHSIHTHPGFSSQEPLCSPYFLNLTAVLPRHLFLKQNTCVGLHWLASSHADTLFMTPWLTTTSAYLHFTLLLQSGCCFHSCFPPCSPLIHHAAHSTQPACFATPYFHAVHHLGLSA